ncbi:MAG: sensor histidine kinase [Caldilineales bacterium]|nr:sensor histidine kinase [Caldilineales bacterium]
MDFDRATLDSPTIWIWGFVALAGVVLAAFIDAILRQSMRRQSLIHELEATQKELAASERRAGVLAERQRLAHEIHDTLAQGFTSIVMHLEAAEQGLPGNEAVVRRHLDFARRTARESLEQARRVVQDLQPQQLDQATLAEAIERVSAAWAEETGLRANVAITGAPRPLPPELEVTLLRTAQEALANIRRHASAGQASLTLSYMPDLVVLDVQDDGVGVGRLPTIAGPEGGFGLQAMRERVTQLGGTLLIESAPGEGTTLVVELPA